jgi:glycosyltransferase 2 family protein
MIRVTVSPMSSASTSEDQTAKITSHRKLAPLGIIFGLLGLALFIYFVRKAGLNVIADGIKRLGAAFLLILAISSIRYVVRALAWTKCIEPPYRLPFRDAVLARLMGDGLGNIIPLASVAVSEPSKAVFVRHRVPLVVGLSGLAIENIFYSMSVALFIFSGTTTLLLTFSLPKPLRYAAAGALIGTIVVVPLVYFFIRRQWKFLSGATTFLGNKGIAATRMNKLTPRAAALEERIYSFYKKKPGSLLAIFGLELTFHLAGILEIYTALSFISLIPPTLLAAFLLESVNRIINVAFKFMPMRVGVDEAGSGMLSKVLGLTQPVGVTLAVIRKGRDIVWTSIGVILILKRGFSLRGVEEEKDDFNAPSTVETVKEFGSVGETPQR